MADYVSVFDADTKNFNKEVDKAKKEVNKLNKETDDVAAGIKKSFADMAKFAGALGVSLSAVSVVTNTFKNAIASTQTTQDAWTVATEKLSSGMSEFYRTLATGDWANFHTNIKLAIQLSEKLTNSLDALDTSKIRHALQIAKIDVDIAKLKAELAKYKKGTDEYESINQQIEELLDKKTKQNNNVIVRYNEALDSMVKKSLLTENTNMNDLIEALDETSDKYQQVLANAEKLKTLTNLTNMDVYSGAGMYRYRDEKKVKIRDQAAAELAEMRANSDITVSKADRIIEKPDDYKEVTELFKERNNLQISLYAEEEAHYKRVRLDEEARLKSLNNVTDELTLQKKLYEDIENFTVNVNVEDVKTAKFDTSGLTTKSEKPKIDFLENPYLSNESVAQYDAMIQRQNQLNEAINIATALYGAQSEKVRELTELQDGMMNADKLTEFMSGLNGVSAAFDQLANSSAAIKDNPAIKALATGMMILNSVMSLKATSSPWEFVAAAIAVAATTITFITSLSAQKFAGGGIVLPAASGDQTQIRVNGNEMILNTNQQTRLFDIIAKKEQTDDSLSKVEFHLRGQELVGLINNHNRKYST